MSAVLMAASVLLLFNLKSLSDRFLGTSEGKQLRLASSTDHTLKLPVSLGEALDAAWKRRPPGREDFSFVFVAGAIFAVTELKKNVFQTIVTVKDSTN